MIDNMEKLKLQTALNNATQIISCLENKCFISAEASAKKVIAALQEVISDDGSGDLFGDEQGSIVETNNSGVSGMADLY